MSRTLIMGLVLFGAMDAMVRPPEAGIGDAVLFQSSEALIRNQADLERRRAIEAGILMPQLRPAVMLKQPAAPAVLVPAGVIVRQAWSNEQIDMWIFRRY